MLCCVFIHKFQVTNKRTNMSTPKEIFLNHALSSAPASNLTFLLESVSTALKLI